MKALSQNRVSWAMLAAGGGSYVFLLATSSDKTIAPLLMTAAIILVLVFRNELSPKHRRVRRRQAGLCPLCGYDLKYDFRTGCSECGWERA